MNNIAWLLRRLPLFGYAPGDYGLQPIHVDDFARLAADAGARRSDEVVDAVGPEVLRFEELVRLVRGAVRSRAALVPLPRAILLAAARLLGPLLGDVVLTPDEVAGLTANLLVSKAPPTGSTRFTEWLAGSAKDLGIEWASELGRHYR